MDGRVCGGNLLAVAQTMADDDFLHFFFNFKIIVKIKNFFYNFLFKWYIYKPNKTSNFQFLPVIYTWWRLKFRLNILSLSPTFFYIPGDFNYIILVWQNSTFILFI